MPLQLNLEKSAGALRLSLEKAGFVAPPVVELCFDLDVSGSYQREHENGTTNDLIARLVPWGMVFDPDKKLDVFTFSDGPHHAHHVGDINASNYENFVRRSVIGKVPGWLGGTDYAYVLQKNLELFGWAEGASRKPNLFQRLMGAKAEPDAQQPAKRKSLVLFNTDGENEDKTATYRLFAEMEAKGHGMYVVFLAVSLNGSRFDFIRELADKYSNVGICIIKDVKTWVQKSDDEINQELITPELINWLKA